MPIKTIEAQRRMAEMGRVRLGDKKGTKGSQRKLDHFRLTSASRELLDAAAAEYGGTVQEWKDAPDEGMFELYTESDRIDVIIPSIFSDRDGARTLAYSQWYELWSGGGCKRRCDGETEWISGKPCLCQQQVDKAGEEARACDPHTRVSFILMVGMGEDFRSDPRAVGFGVWRLESKGYNAAVEMPGMLEALQAAADGGKFVPARVRIDHRSQVKDGQTRRFIVPVIELRSPTIRALPGMARAAGLAGGALALNAPAEPESRRPELPQAPEPPSGTQAGFADPEPAHGAPPPLPGRPDEPDVDDDEEIVDADVVESMSKADYAAAVAAAGIPKTEQTKIARQLYPGRTFGSLDDEEIWRLWQAIRPQEQLPVGA